LQKFFLYLLVLGCLLLNGLAAHAQFTISGTVYDSTKIVPVKNVIVKSTSGAFTITDSTGQYAIFVTDKDSISFFYNDKPTVRFAVKQIQNLNEFDISLHVKVAEKFRTMREVRVYSKSYRQDSLDNREQYAKVFGFERPGLSTSGSSGYSGTPGLDLDEFINIFRVRRNRTIRKLQQRLLDEEQEKYINYRFNKTLVKRITHLEGPALDSFMIFYRPDYNFVQNSTITQFYQYILNCSYAYKQELLKQSAYKKEGTE